MVDDQPFTDEAEQLNEQLSAYIDGELSPEENLRLEKQLATDEKIRDQLEVLKRNWGVLEVLPRENVSSRFTASTVEMVAIRAAENPTIGEPNTPGWVRLRPRWLIILTAAFLSGAVGYVASSTITKISPISGLLENENTFLLKHLNFLEHFTEYQLTENIEFLKQLNEIEYFSSPAKSPEHVFIEWILGKEIGYTKTILGFRRYQKKSRSNYCFCTLIYCLCRMRKFYQKF